MLIPWCRAITTFFMRMPIDVLFVDKEGRVVGLIEALPPWRNAIGPPGTSAVLELPVGALRDSCTQVGHRLEFSP